MTREGPSGSLLAPWHEPPRFAGPSAPRKSSSPCGIHGKCLQLLQFFTPLCICPMPAAWQGICCLHFETVRNKLPSKYTVESDTNDAVQNAFLPW